MRSFFFLLSALLFSCQLNAQIEFHYNGADAGGGHGVGFPGATDMQTLVHIVNLNGTSEDVHIERKRIEHTTGWSDNIHMQVGFSIPDQDLWQTPISEPTSAGDSITLDMFVYPDSIFGCSVYQYTIINANSLVREDSIQIMYKNVSGDCGTFSSISESKPVVSIYPNPSNGALLFIENAADQTTYAIVNLLGQKIKEGPLNKQGTSVDISSLACDSYFILLKNAEGVIESKLKWIKN